MSFLATSLGIIGNQPTALVRFCRQIFSPSAHEWSNLDLMGIEPPNAGCELLRSLKQRLQEKHLKLSGGFPVGTERAFRRLFNEGKTATHQNLGLIADAVWNFVQGAKQSNDNSVKEFWSRFCEDLRRQTQDNKRV
jgi:hypothetical protein